MAEPDQPRGARPPADGTDATVALLLDHEENRRRLAEWLQASTDYTPVVVEADDLTVRGDLCLVDLPALVHHRDWALDVKSSAHPRFYPVLLAHDGTQPLDESLWTVVDETISTPVQLPELRARLGNLLERRRLSRDLARQLERTEERYETVFEAVNDAILVLDPEEGRIVDCNPRATDMLGYSRAELQSLSPCEDLHRGDERACRSFLERVRETGRARASGIECVRKDGSTLVVEVSANRFDERGDPRVVLTVRDVTERHEQERLVERQRDRLVDLNRLTRTLYETIQAVVHASNREELETEVCRRLAASDEYQFAWIGVQEGGDVVPRAYGGAARSYLERVDVTADGSSTGRGPSGQALETGEVTAVQAVADDPRMEPWREALAAFDIRATAAVPIRHDERAFGVLNLYTRRSDAFTGEERVILDHLGRTIGRAITRFRTREEAQLFQQAVEHAANAIYIMDTSGTITYVNPAFEEMTGYTSDEAVGRTLEMLKSDEHGPSFYHDLWRTLRAGDIWVSEIVNRRKDGRRRYVDQTIAPIVDSGGEIERFVAVNTDITEQRRRGQQLQVLYRVLRHNLRNQLNIIDGYTEFLDDVADDAASRDAVAEVSDAVGDLLRLSRQARRIEGTFVGDERARERPPLHRVLRDAVNSVDLEPVAGGAMSIPDTDYRVDPELGSAVEELLRNAVQHNDAERPECSLTLGTAVDDGVPRATVTVADNGPGIPENERRVLRKGEETPLLHGDGLGLWLVNWIVSELGGDIDIADNDPRGSVVTLHVPVSE